MLSVPPDVAQRLDAAMQAAGIALHVRPHMQRWLRFYLDFCGKYGHDPRLEASFLPFAEKLEQRGQAPWKRQQALDAVKLFWGVLPVADPAPESSSEAMDPPQPAGRAALVTLRPSAPVSAGGIAPAQGEGRKPLVVRSDPARDAGSSVWTGAAAAAVAAPTEPGHGPAPGTSLGPGPKPPPSGARMAAKTAPGGAARPAVTHPQRHRPPPHAAKPVPTEQGPPSADSRAPTDQDWASAYVKLEAAIKVRHYAPKTLKSYRSWTRKLQGFVRNRGPTTLTTEDVKAFLTFLAVEQHVSASSQNQAFNALLFLFRHVLEKDFGRVEGVVRAKRKPDIPVVLSRREVHQVIAALDDPYDLVAQVLYGCGLRLFECLQLRVQDLNLDMMVLTVHDDKGKKDRTVPLPQALRSRIELQMDRVVTLHRSDLADGYDGVFLPTALDAKYKNAAKELVWQWVFPAKMLTAVPGTRERRRFHLHESHVQKAIKQAVLRSEIRKRASAHTLRHSYASHLLAANYDISTIQQLLGHSDVRTTMIYTHTIPSTTVKEAKSPLDFDSET